MVKLSIRLIKHHSMRTYRGAEVWLRAILISAIDGAEVSFTFPSLIPRSPVPTGTLWRGETYIFLLGINSQLPSYPVYNLVTIPTELSVKSNKYCSHYLFLCVPQTSERTLCTRNVLVTSIFAFRKTWTIVHRNKCLGVFCFWNLTGSVRQFFRVIVQFCLWTLLLVHIVLRPMSFRFHCPQFCIAQRYACRNLMSVQALF
jgi:hypothetical protein